MSATIAVLSDWVESVGNLRLSPKADHRLQELMDRNSEGVLTGSEREGLEALTEMNEQLSIVRAETLLVLGKSVE